MSKSIDLYFFMFNFQGYVRVIKCCLILGDIVDAENMLQKLLELDPDNNTIAAEQKDLAYVKKYLEDANIAYNAKDYRKVSALR